MTKHLSALNVKVKLFDRKARTCWIKYNLNMQTYEMIRLYPHSDAENNYLSEKILNQNKIPVLWWLSMFCGNVCVQFS